MEQQSQGMDIIGVINAIANIRSSKAQQALAQQQIKLSADDLAFKKQVYSDAQGWSDKAGNRITYDLISEKKHELLAGLSKFALSKNEGQAKAVHEAMKIINNDLSAAGLSRASKILSEAGLDYQMPKEIFTDLNDTTLGYLGSQTSVLDLIPYINPIIKPDSVKPQPAPEQSPAVQVTGSIPNQSVRNTYLSTPEFLVTSAKKKAYNQTIPLPWPSEKSDKPVYSKAPFNSDPLWFLSFPGNVKGLVDRVDNSWLSNYIRLRDKKTAAANKAFKEGNYGRK